MFSSFDYFLNVPHGPPLLIIFLPPIDSPYTTFLYVSHCSKPFLFSYNYSYFLLIQAFYLSIYSLTYPFSLITTDSLSLLKFSICPRNSLTLLLYIKLHIAAVFDFLIYVFHQINNIMDSIVIDIISIFTEIFLIRFLKCMLNCVLHHNLI